MTIDPSIFHSISEWMMKDISSRKEWREEVEHGKMFGFLLVEGTSPMTHTIPGIDVNVLMAYSGQILGRSDWEGYVPAIFDYLQPDGYFKTHEAVISNLNARISEAEALLPKGKRTREVEDMKAERKERSQTLQRWLFSQFILTSPERQESDVLKIFTDYSTRNNSKQQIPPGGTGECCAPKLLHYANRHNLKPIAVAEFWYGGSPKGEVRHHGQFYEPCQSKCMPILDFLAPEDLIYFPFIRKTPKPEIHIIYEDEWFVAIEKSAGLLSVPGKRQLPNAEDMLRAMVANRDNGFPKMIHRLDMDTSGILLAAKDEETYKIMQRMFAEHNQVKKEYLAILSKKQGEDISIPLSGTITLPLAPDFINRPMQIVDNTNGKTSITEYSIDSKNNNPHSDRIAITLWPKTGRTHQLRVHCAHKEGLGMPILGDSLYGNTPAERMYLHAHRLEFIHPYTSKKTEIVSKPWQ